MNYFFEDEEEMFHFQKIEIFVFSNIIIDCTLSYTFDSFFKILVSIRVKYGVIVV